MILCAVSSTISYHTSDGSIKENPLIEETIDVRCQGGESTLTSCSISQQNNGCYVAEFYQYANVSCTEGKKFKAN